MARSVCVCVCVCNYVDTRVHLDRPAIECDILWAVKNSIGVIKSDNKNSLPQFSSVFIACCICHCAFGAQVCVTV